MNSSFRCFERLIEIIPIPYKGISEHLVKIIRIPHRDYLLFDRLRDRGASFDRLRDPVAEQVEAQAWNDLRYSLLNAWNRLEIVVSLQYEREPTEDKYGKTQ